MEHILGAEDTGILGIKAEHQADTELIQTFLTVRILRVDVLGQELFIEDANDLTGLDTDLQLLLDMDIGIIDQEGKAGEFFFKVLEEDDFRSVVGVLHVMDLEGLEVAGDNPTGSH